MKQRVALVTGGGRGIGREAALLLSAAGARVMVVARSAAELAAVGLEYVAADLGTAEGCALAVAETERRLGPIDVLVVNHGIGSAHERLVWEQDPEVWRETMRVNLDGPFELARLAVGGMCKRGFGRLVFTSSTAGEKAERAGSAYSASKHGLIGLARAVAQDAGPFGVTSNAVLPGWVRTAMAERSAQTEAERRGISVEAVWEERAAIYPQKRVLEPREVAQVIAFLCSEAAGGVNGEAITVALRVISAAISLAVPWRLERTNVEQPREFLHQRRLGQTPCGENPRCDQSGDGTRLYEDFAGQRRGRGSCRCGGEGGFSRLFAHHSRGAPGVSAQDSATVQLALRRHRRGGER